MDLVKTMKKKIIIFCFLMITMLMVLPMASSYCLVTERQPFVASGFEKQLYEAKEKSVPSKISGYLLIHVSVYTPGEGVHPYEGANISVRGLLRSYQGTTDERGDCLFHVYTHLFRAKRYVMKVSIAPDDWLHTKINSLFIEPREIVYKDFLFIVL